MPTPEKKNRQPIAQGATGRLVAHNLGRLRKESGITAERLVADMERGGHKLPRTAISDIEGGYRRVSADDLMALSIALNVNPNALLLPAHSGNEDESNEITGIDEVVSGADIWAWADGWKALPIHRANVSEVDSDACGIERGRQMYRKQAAEEGNEYLRRVRPQGESEKFRWFLANIYDKAETIKPGEWLSVWGHSEDSKMRADRVDIYPAPIKQDLFELMKQLRFETLGVLRASVGVVSPEDAATAVTPNEDE